MRLVDIMSEDLVIEELQAGTRDEVLAELVERIKAHAPSVNAPQALRFLIERERIGSTGVSRGIAIPHARVPGLEGLIGCFGRSVGGVEFGALDGNKTHLFLTLLAPDVGGGVHLKALARASRMFKDADTYRALVDAPDRNSLWTTISTKDEQLSQ